MADSKTGSESENLSRIRDILFGEDLQSIEQKLAFFKKENSEINSVLKNEIEDRFGKLEKSIEDKLGLANNIQKECTESQNKINSDTKKEIVDLSSKIKTEKEKIETNLNQETKKIIEKISELEKTINDAIKNFKDDQNVILEDLDKSKVSKESISKMLIELAEKLKQ